MIRQNIEKKTPGSRPTKNWPARVEKTSNQLKLVDFLLLLFFCTEGHTLADFKVCFFSSVLPAVNLLLLVANSLFLLLRWAFFVIDFASVCCFFFSSFLKVVVCSWRRCVCVYLCDTKVVQSTNTHHPQPNITSTK